jgi:hypothetical protein
MGLIGPSTNKVVIPSEVRGARDLLFLSARVPHPFTPFVKGAQGDHHNQRKSLHAPCKKTAVILRSARPPSAKRAGGRDEGPQPPRLASHRKPTRPKPSPADSPQPQEPEPSADLRTNKQCARSCRAPWSITTFHTPDQPTHPKSETPRHRKQPQPRAKQSSYLPPRKTLPPPTAVHPSGLPLRRFVRDTGYSL